MPSRDAQGPAPRLETGHPLRAGEQTPVRGGLGRGGGSLQPATVDRQQSYVRKQLSATEESVSHLRAHSCGTDSIHFNPFLNPFLSSTASSAPTDAPMCWLLLGTREPSSDVATQQVPGHSLDVGMHCLCSPPHINHRFTCPGQTRSSQYSPTTRILLQLRVRNSANPIWTVVTRSMDTFPINPLIIVAS